MITARIQSIRQDHAFLRKTILLAGPVAIQGFLNNILNMIDSLMIGSLGETPIAAVGLANKVFFVFSLLCFGICSGSGVLSSQYWGTKDIKSMRKVLGISLIFGVVGSLVIAIPSILAPQMVMRIFTPNQDTIMIGASYLGIVAFSYPINAISQCYITILRSMNQVKIPVIISFLSLFVNAGINYVLIFGRFGMPQLGAPGAAIGTLVARIFECLAILAVLHIQRHSLVGKVTELFRLESRFVMHFIRTALPVIVNEFMWGLGVTMYSLVYGRMGDNAVAAITITQTFEQLFSVVFQSISASTAVILGNELGAGRLQKAEEYAKNFMFMQVVLTILVGIILYFMRWPIISMYNVTPEVGRYVALCFISFICYMPSKMFNYVNIVGVLRSGGDTISCLILDTTGVWCIGIPMAVLGGLILKAPIYIVYAMVLSEEIYKTIFGFLRYKKKKWLRNLVMKEE
ncbi:MAG: MATE family efflux transporter [Clostridiales bacterium]|nr:MATE family efflux transporter [Clostridiales bacterium]